VAGTLPGLEIIPADWTTFFVAVAETSATLAGLSFVAVSAHPPLLTDRRTRGRAQRSLTAFIIVFITALGLSMPRLPYITAASIILWLAGTSLILAVVSLARQYEPGHLRAWLKLVWSSESWTTILVYVAGMVWAFIHRSPSVPPLDLYALASGMVGWLGVSAFRSWQLMLTGLRARISGQPATTDGAAAGTSSGTAAMIPPGSDVPPPRSVQGTNAG
jgi:hypothetical protein